MIRPGVTSRSRAISSRASHRARTAPRARRPRTRCSPGRTPPRLDAHGRLEARAGARTPGAPTRPCRPRPSSAARSVAQLDEHLDVEGGVLQPRLGQRPGRPVDGGVLLAHAGGRAASRRGWPGRPGGSPAAGRRARCRTARVGTQARPRRGRAGPGWRRAGSTRCPSSASCSGARESKAIGSTSAGAGALAAQLDQVGARGVAVARGALGVDRDRTGAGGERGAGLGQRRPGCRRSGAGRRAARAAGPAAARGVSAGVAGVGRSCCVGRGVVGRHRGQCPAPRWPRRLGIAVTPSGTGGRPAAVHSSSPHASTCGADVEAPRRTSTVGRRRPGGADLDLGGAALVGHAAEALGGHPGDGAGGGDVRRAVGVERLGQPGPADRGQHRVGDQLEVDLGAGVGHAAEGAVPGVVAGRVVQQDDPAGADVVAVDGDVGATARRRTARSAAARASPRRRPRGAAGRACMRAHRRPELRGARAPHPSGVRLLTDDHGVTVGRRVQSPMCEHAA